MELFLPTTTPIHQILHHTLEPILLPTTTTLCFRKFKNNSSTSNYPFHSKLKLNARTTTATISTRASLLQSPTTVPTTAASTRWVVVMEKPPSTGTTKSYSSSKADIIDYYVRTLATVVPTERDAQMCIYNASWDGDFVFCCDIDEDSSRQLARVPGVLSVRPDRDLLSIKDCSYSNDLLPHQSNSVVPASKFSPSAENSDYWLVKMEKPGFEVVTKAQMVDYFAQTLTKVLGSEKDAQVSIYNISWERDFGFCCQIDEECAQELSGVPGVISVQPDLNFESENKYYKDGNGLLNTKGFHGSSETSPIPDVKTKRLFVTGLSFYTSEKTLRAAFEPFGELVEVKIIMDKISKRSKGYAFIEYTTEEAAGAALKDMNGKIINGWMIVVDVAKVNPPKHNRRPARNTI